MITDIKVSLLKDYRKNARAIYCEAKHDTGSISVEKLDVPKTMPDDVALHYGRQLFENTLRKKGYEIAESEQ